VKGAGSVKADQWKTLLLVFFVALFEGWQVNGQIPDRQASQPASNTKVFKAKAAQERLYLKRLRNRIIAENPNIDADDLPTMKDAIMDRSLRRHYNVLLQFSAAVRNLSSHHISPNEVRRSCAALSGAVQEWAAMRCHLTPYFHIAMHLEQQLYKFGPAPSCWAYPYERNNRTLGRFNHNGHSGGELECTMMRGWWKSTMIHDLVSLDLSTLIYSVQSFLRLHVWNSFLVQ